MRKLPLGVAISLIVHVGALAYVALFVLPDRRDVRDARPPVTIEVIAVTPAPPAPEAPPMEVALLDDTPAAARPLQAPVAPPPKAQPANHAPAAVLAASSHAGSAAELPAAASPARGEPPATPGKPSLLAMRRGDAPGIVIPAGAIDAIASIPHGTPEVELHTGLLHDNGTGKKSDQGTFVARVDADGNVKLDDAPNVGGGGVSGLGGVGHFDVSDALMRRHGMDPYLAAKLKFLDATRDERAQLGAKHRADQLAHSTQLMQRNLAAMWAVRGTLADKKLALFELWDECADTGDASLVAGADDARRMVIGFIRGHLPAGSATAYTADELAELARHQLSKATFRPYEEE